MRSRHATRNPFLDPGVANRYEAWYAGEGRHADLLEKALLGKLLDALDALDSVLEVGCGTGHFTRWMAQRNLQAVGIDASEPMLSEALRRGEAQYVIGDAHALPFADRSHDLTAMITTLEFLADPARALGEAVRVARHGVLLGTLNRWSLVALRHRLSGKGLWRCARFFGPWELANLVRAAAGRRARHIRWRTTLSLWPSVVGDDTRLPWGGFIGMAVRLHDGPTT